MTIKCNNEMYLNLTTKQLEKIKTLSEEGKVSFELFNFDIITTFLYNCFTFPNYVSEYDARDIISKSIYKIAKEEISQQKLIEEIESQLNQFLSRPIQRYALVALISLSKFQNLNNIYLDNCRLIFENYLSLRFNNQDRKKLLSDAARSTPAEIPDDYSFVRVFVSSRSVFDAANKALENLDIIRGIWNYIINRSFSYRKSFIGKPDPINKIILGPIHTLHDLEGNLACDKWWYEPNYFGQIKTYNPSKNELNKLKKSEKFVRMRLKNLNYRDEIESAFIRYSKALDERDITSAFLKLWGVLEALTSTTKGTNYEVTAKRVASLYQERDFHYHKLNILKEYRNSYVHSGEEPNEQETYLIQLKNYVESLFQFHLTNKLNFSSIQRAAEFFDITANKKELNYKIRLLNNAKKFRNY